MTQWRKVKLGELSSKNYGAIAIGPFGSRMKADSYVHFGIPVIRGTNISDDRTWQGDWVYISEQVANSMPNCNVRSGDLVFPHRGSIGEVAIIPDDSLRYMISTSLMKFTPDPEKANPLYLFYYFRSSTGRAEIMKYSSQVGTPGIGQPLASMKQFEVCLPPLTEQKKIASLLSIIDDKIELNRRMNETLEGIAQALFKSWFVDFDPVKAKAEGRKLEGMDDATIALFPSNFTESILGLIPEGWEISEIGREVEVVGGATPSTQKSAYWEDGRFYWATPKDLSKLKSPILLNTERKITELGVKQISSGQLPIDTVLLSSRAPVGYIALTKVPTSINQGFIAMKCNDRLSPYYIMNWAHYSLEEIKARATGTTFAEISKSVFRPIKVVVPSKSIIQLFNCIAKPIYDRIMENDLNASALINTRDLLLERLISGKLRVSNLPKENTTS